MSRDTSINQKKLTLGARLARYKKAGNFQLDLMMLPVMIMLTIFSIFPMYGIFITFTDFIPAKGVFGSDFVGLHNFARLLEMPNITNVVFNTLFIAVLKLVIGFPIPIIFALLLNEVTHSAFKKTVQTVSYLPFFLSWVIIAGIVLDVFSLGGFLNRGLEALFGILGFEAIPWLSEGNWFVVMLIISEVWKGFGWGSIIYLAAISGVDMALYESAVIDGARRWKQTIHITLPAIMPIVMLNLILNLGNVVNAGFDQIYNLINPLVEAEAQIIDTLVFDLGFGQYPDFVMSTLIGLLKSIVSAILIASGWYIAKKHSDYTVF